MSFILFLQSGFFFLILTLVLVFILFLIEGGDSRWEQSLEFLLVYGIVETSALETEIEFPTEVRSD